MHDNEKDLDNLLDAALEDYSSAEPRAGLEGRIIARLAGAEQTHVSLWARWWPALTFAAAIVVIAIVFLSLPRKTSQQDIAKEVSPPAILPASQTSPGQSVKTAPPRRHRPQSHAKHAPDKGNIIAVPVQRLAVVRQDVFPSPSPLTDQEKLLFAYLRRTPGDEIVAQSKPDEVPEVFKQQNYAIPARPSDSNLGK